MSRLLSSPAAIRALPPPVAAGIADSLELAIRSVFLWAVPLMAAGFVLSWFVKEIPLRETVGPARPVEGTGDEIPDAESARTEVAP